VWIAVLRAIARGRLHAMIAAVGAVLQDLDQFGAGRLDIDAILGDLPDEP